MGREIQPFSLEVKPEQVRLSEGEASAISARKEKVVIRLARTGVDVRIQTVGSEEEERCKLGDPSRNEGEERIEITVSATQTTLNWKVVERDMWCLKHRIGFLRTQLGEHDS